MEIRMRFTGLSNSVKVACMATTALLLLSSTSFGQAIANAAKSDAQKSTAEQKQIAFYAFGDESVDGRKARTIGLINEDGSGERYPDFGVPGQISWQFHQLFADGRRLTMTSWGEIPRPGRRLAATSLDSTARSRKWIYDLPTGKLREIVYNPPDMAGVQALLPSENRIIVGTQPLVAVDLDGGNPVELTKPQSGYVYGVSLSPDGDRLAFHITGGEWGDLKKPSPFSLGHYNINVLDLKTHERILVAGAPGHLYFGPQWSPDGQWLAYLDCQPEKSPNHFRGDVCVGNIDGTKHRVLTEGQPHWFGAHWGTSEYSGGGSNMVSWSPDGSGVLFTRIFGNSGNDQSRGGSQLCLLNPVTRQITELTAPEESLWVHHANWSRNGKRIVFTRANVGQPSELWMMNRDGSGQRMLTKGYRQRGVDLGGRFLSN